MMEEWNAGMPDRWVGWVEPAKPITPVFDFPPFHHSIIPIFPAIFLDNRKI
jgi:hypothetical protein